MQVIFTALGLFVLGSAGRVALGRDPARLEARWTAAARVSVQAALGGVAGAVGGALGALVPVTVWCDALPVVMVLCVAVGKIGQKSIVRLGSTNVTKEAMNQKRGPSGGNLKALPSMGEGDVPNNDVCI